MVSGDVVEPVVCEGRVPVRVEFRIPGYDTVVVPKPVKAEETEEERLTGSR